MAIDIDWNKAPEGTTHYLQSVDYGNKHWLRREGNLYHWLEVGRDGQFEMNKAAVWSENYENPAWYVLIERPPIEAALPDGLVWPKGATHFNPTAGGLFINERNFQYKMKELTNWFTPQLGTVEWWLRHEDTIARYGVGKKQQPKAEEKPLPKRQVGWWA